MSNDPDSVEDPADLDVSSVIDYMERNGVGRLDLTIEAMNVTREQLSVPKTVLSILERRSISEDELPSPFGLRGVYAIFEVDDRE
jgi:hypothetical protein